MLLFALECSAAAASAALYRDDRLLGEEFLNIPQTHSVTSASCQLYLILFLFS